ncbi:MAG: hypothetical protein KDA28_16740, partial [Phycisphaerales bacterium]|nr:hypothetical protein [Phycisphaerales bacterium]
RQRALLLRVVRIAFLVLLITVTLLTILEVTPGSESGSIALAIGWPVTLGMAVVLGVTVILVDVFTPSKKIATLSSVFLGLIIAMVATIGIGFVVDLLVNAYDVQSAGLVATVKVIIGICVAYLAITTVLQTQDDFRLVIPYVEFAKQLRGTRSVLVDSAALIDARIVEVAETGFIQSPLIIPRYVIGELQTLADLQDKMKRARGRRGLETVARLQRMGTVDIAIDERPYPTKSVDQMLVEQAREMDAIIMTSDIALSRVAAIHGVGVLNMNELANALKPSVIPGETLTVHLMREGEQPGQAVGYLEDGTMVIAEDGVDQIGHTVVLVITSAMQTSAGRLIFGKLARLDAAPAPGAPADATPEPLDQPDRTARATPQEAPEPGGAEARVPSRPGDTPQKRRRSKRNPRR